MHFLAFSDNPLGHVVDVTIIGGKDPLVSSTASGVPILTMHMVTMLIAALLTVWMMMTVASLTSRPY